MIRGFSPTQPFFTKGRDNCLFLDDLNREICGVEMPPVIIADSAYPLLSWVLKGYTLGTRQQEVNVFLTIVLRSRHTGRDSTTRRDFLVFES